MQEILVQFLGQEDPLEKEMATSPIFLPRKSHGQRRLAGCSLWGRKESDTTERLHFTSLHGLYSPWNSLGQNTGVGSLSLLQKIFPTQRSNPGLPHCRQILYLLSHKGRPRILDWVAYPFSSRSSQPRNRTGVSCITGGFLSS